VGAPVSRETIVMSWVDAFNARDIDGILAVLARGVDFHRCGWAGLPPVTAATVVCESGSGASATYVTSTGSFSTKRETLLTAESSPRVR
jgi:hypothetical protein